MLTREYWSSLCPDLRITSQTESVVRLNEPSPEKWRQELNRLDYDGHFVFEEVVSLAAAEKLKLAVERLVAANRPAIFASLFDEFWEMVAALKPLGQTLLGEDYMIFPDYWVWHIDHRKSQAGWKPHRETTVKVADPSYPTDSISAWVALSEATPENGCVYVLPKSKDKGYPHTLKFDVNTLQHVKALSVKAGSVIGWNQSVFHWGASNSIEAKHSRISFAMEFRPVSKKRDIPFMMPSDYFPTFEERLKLVAMQFVNYKHLHGLWDEPELRDFINTVLGETYEPA